ncbi:MAG: HNH endonuclease [Gammaproteobacteria bacterium]|nr:HNH endonuclease [Gammaproteobacteria bacterium]
MTRQTLYNYKWRQASKRFLKQTPMCAMCIDRGQATPSAIVDHITPHRGNQGLFWDVSNWQALCKHCHDSHKQRFEKSGVYVGCKTDGAPLDKGHHWYKQK